MAERSRKPLKILLPVVLLVAVAVAVFLYLRTKRENEQQLFSGTLEARTSDVGSLYGGRVTRVLVDEGAVVAPGQVLMTLETETVDRQIEEQRAAIDAARASLAKAIAGPREAELAKARAVAMNDAADQRRAANLYRAGILAKEQLDDATTKAKTSAEDLRLLEQGTRKEDIAAARAQLEQQERRLETLMKQREESVVKSSVGGVVQSIGLRPGDLVNPNQSVAEILEANQLWVRVYVPETQLGRVRVGMPVRVRIDSPADVWFRGHVASVSSRGEYTPRNVQTRSQRADQVFGVKIDVDNDPRLKAGMAADVDFGANGPGTK